MSVCVCLCLCVAVSVSVCLCVCLCVWICVNMCEYEWMCVNMSECVWMCVGMWLCMLLWVVGVAVAVGMGMCRFICMSMCVCVCGGVLLLVFRGKILGYVGRRTTTEPFTKDVVIDHERRLGDWRHQPSSSSPQTVWRLDIFSSTFGEWFDPTMASARGAGIHGDVLNLHTEAFVETTHGVFSVPHHTAHHTTPHTQTHTTTHTTTHTPPTHGERREKEKRRRRQEKRKEKKKKKKRKRDM